MAVGQGDQLEQVGILYISTLELMGWPVFFKRGLALPGGVFHAKVLL